MNNKIYARQISPEYQESPLYLGEEFWPDDIILTGNRDYREHTTAPYDAIIAAGDLAEIGYRGAQVFYDALLVDVSTPETIGYISGKDKTGNPLGRDPINHLTIGSIWQSWLGCIFRCYRSRRDLVK